MVHNYGVILKYYDSATIQKAGNIIYMHNYCNEE